MAIIQNPAQGAGRQAFTSMLGIFDLIGTARSLDLRKAQSDLEAGSKAAEIQAKTDVLNVSKAVQQYNISNPTHAALADQQAQQGNMGIYDDLGRIAIKKGMITPQAYQQWKTDYSDMIKKTADSTQAVQKVWETKANTEADMNNLYGGEAIRRQAQRSDPQTYLSNFMVVKASNSPEEQVAMKDAILYNYDTSGSVIPNPDGTPSMKKDVDGNIMKGANDPIAAKRQYWIERGVKPSPVSTGSFFSQEKYGKANAEMAVQGKAEDEARITRAKTPVKSEVLQGLIADIPGLDFNEEKQKPFIDRMMLDADAALIKNPNMTNSELRKTLIDSGERYKFIIIDPNKDIKRGWLSKALYNPTDFKIADDFSSNSRGVTPAGAVGQMGTFDAQGNQVSSPVQSGPTRESVIQKLKAGGTLLPEERVFFNDETLQYILNKTKGKK